MFYEDNKILTMLGQKRIPLGTQCFTGSTSLVEVMGSTGFDFVMFDAEHSGNDARAMRKSSVPPRSQEWQPISACPIRITRPTCGARWKQARRDLFCLRFTQWTNINAAANAAYF